jgi:RNA polymerase-associated protein RTF1
MNDTIPPKEETAPLKEEKSNPSASIKKERILKKNKSHSHKRRSSDDSSSYSYDDGYDSEYIGDEKDAENLEAMNQVDRELIIEERREKRQREKDKRKLEREAKQRDNNATKDKRGQALSELTRKRLDRQNKLANKHQSGSGSSDDSSRRSDDDDYEAEDKITKKRKRSSSPREVKKTHKPEPRKEVEKSDLETIRLSRKTLEMLCGHDIFAKTIAGCYVRINIASAAKQQTQNYVIAKISDVREYHKSYKMDEKETNKVLVLKYGKKEFQMKMIFVSNTEFGTNELNEWKKIMQKSGLPLPSIEEIQAKAKELKRGLNHRYSNDEINERVNKKIDEKLRKGEKLIPHEISILEERINQYELLRLRESTEENPEKKRWADDLREKIKKAKTQNDVSLVRVKSAMKKEGVAQEEDMEMEEQNDNYEEEEKRDTDQWKIKQELPQKSQSQSEYLDELRREFKKMHNVNLSIDTLIDEWQVETGNEKLN